MKKLLYIALLLCFSLSFSQTQTDIYDIVENVSAKRIQNDIQTLVDFGTRNTFSDTISETRGIGAARRWIKKEFELISNACNNCIDVFYQKDFVTKKGNNRVPHDAWVVNVVAVQKGTKYPNRYVIMSGDIPWILQLMLQEQTIMHQEWLVLLRRPEYFQNTNLKIALFTWDYQVKNKACLVVQD